MLTDEQIARSPMHALTTSIRGGLEPGQVGGILARWGADAGDAAPAHYVQAARDKLADLEAGP